MGLTIGQAFMLESVIRLNFFIKYTQIQNVIVRIREIELSFVSFG